MFEPIKMPSPESLTGLDDLGLVDAVATATLVESLAVEVRRNRGDVHPAVTDARADAPSTSGPPVIATP
jgi:hypothetical protein